MRYIIFITSTKPKIYLDKCMKVLYIIISNDSPYFNEYEMHNNNVG